MSAWISVAQSLPDKNTDVIVACEDGYVQAGYLEGRDWLWINSEKEIRIGVTHWRPFPEPPTKEEAQ